jgi:hypothetical protein
MASWKFGIHSSPILHGKLVCEVEEAHKLFRGAGATSLPMFYNVIPPYQFKKVSDLGGKDGGVPQAELRTSAKGHLAGRILYL